MNNESIVESYWEILELLRTQSGDGTPLDFPSHQMLMVAATLVVGAQLGELYTVIADTGDKLEATIDDLTTATGQ